MAIIKWLQLSDIHFGSPDAYVIKTMRDNFLEKCNKLQGIDYLFITGDLCYGKDNSEVYSDESVQFLRNVQKNLSISTCNTFMVPGNHDVLRGDGRKGTIEAVMETYTRSRTISSKHLKELKPGIQDYLNFYEQICGKHEIRNHFFISKDNVNIIHINTAVLSGKDNEDGNLVIDMLELKKILESIDKNKPAIVLAHHPFECLDVYEQGQLEILLKNHNVILYLCGHKHLMRRKNINVTRTEIDLWEYLCGSNMDNPYNAFPADKGFFTGKLDTEMICGYVKGFRWSEINGAWIPNSDFSFPQDCAIDGKYYFPKRQTSSENLIEIAHKEYIKYLRDECKIRLDGLPPVDNDFGNKAFELDELFVPLRFSEPIYRNNKIHELSDIDNIFDIWHRNNYEWSNLSWNECYDCLIPDKGNIRLVIFSGPGGGKTTWMKRLASFYGINKSNDDLFNKDLNHVYDIYDKLPNRCLFPIWIKCRQFKNETDLSINDIIRKIPERADFEDELKNAFFELVSSHIQNGTALLLVDGLDEINDNSNRKTFINKLCQFIENNEQVNIVMTSRIVGYPLIAKNLTKIFNIYKIQPFNLDDINRLCICWHKIALSGTKDTEEEARKLFNTIQDNEKIFDLAQTPVLLMTLQIVHLWIGYLPTKRAELYGSAIDVLIRTWNVPGFPSLDYKEAIPQLAYLAYNMTFVGKRRQTIGRTELEKILMDARKDLSRFFSSKSEPITKFIERVEERSALLIKKGLRRVNDNNEILEGEYEFSHLTFQEYLAAYAIVRNCYPNVTRNKKIESHFYNLFEDEGMKETILLTSVLVDDSWSTEDISIKLLEILSNIKAKPHINRESRASYIINLLMQIIADEAPLTPSIRNNIYKECFGYEFFIHTIDSGIMVVYKSKYSEELINSLQEINKEWPIKIYSNLFKLIELRYNEKEQFSIYNYFIQNLNSCDFPDVLQMLNLAILLGIEWQGIALDSDNTYILRNILIDLCSNENELIAISAYEILELWYNEDDYILPAKFLKELFKLSAKLPNCMQKAFNFPVRHDTILYLHGLVVNSLQKEDLIKRYNEANSVHSLLGYFWFGIIFGAWNINYIILESKKLLDMGSDCLGENNIEMHRKKMQNYLIIIQEADVVPIESKYLVEEHLTELIQMEKQKLMFNF